MSVENSNKRIVKNSIMLYIRMLISIVVSLYTSRIVLKTLGAEDYGVYNVVGGVVAMFSFLNASMSGATSRFLTVALGKNDQKLSNDTFSSALLAHIGIAAVVFVLIETIGIWFLNNKLIIPPERIIAAHIILQCSVISMFFNVTQVPYNASIIAHEDMDIYAYVELLNVFLKLGVVFLLSIGSCDKLILYAILMALTSITVAVVYRIYCLRHYQECKFHFIWEPSIIKPLLSFSGWDVLGNMSFIAKTQGTSFIFNMLYGVTMNAANGIATTVQGIIQGFSSNIIQAFRPAIIKNYASENFENQQSYTESALRISSLLLSLVSVPLIIETKYVMTLWLGDVPEYAEVFCQVLLVINYFSTASNCVIISIHANGKVKFLSFLGVVTTFFTLLFIYFSLSTNRDIPQNAYLITLAMSAISFLSVLWYLKRIEPCLNIIKILKSFVEPFLLGCICCGIANLIQNFWEASFLRLCIITIANIVIEGTLAYWFILTGNERELVKQYLTKLIHRKGHKGE